MELDSDPREWKRRVHSFPSNLTSTNPSEETYDQDDKLHHSPSSQTDNQIQLASREIKKLKRDGNISSRIIQNLKLDLIPVLLTYKDDEAPYLMAEVEFPRPRRQA